MPGTIRPPEAGREATASSPGQALLAHRVSAALTSLVETVTPGAGDATPDPAALATPKVCPSCGVRFPSGFRVCPHDASELVEASSSEEVDDLIGTVLRDTYAIVRVLGEGGMGRVYEARHARIRSKRFAVKMLHPEFMRQPDVLSRFQREAEAAAGIESPFCVDVYDVDRAADGRPYIVGELLEGKELAIHLGEVGRLAVGPAVRIARQVASALGAAHALGVVHRDVKPENVFLTGDIAWPTAKVIDFGISKTADSSGAALTKTGMIMGTPSYMAPEQARGERVDHRCDVYAVGAMLYAALTGQRPFDRGDPTATLTAVLTQEPARPRSLEPSIPEGLEHVIQRAMARSPDHRYQSMAELEADLVAFDPGGANLFAPRASSTAISFPAAPANDRQSRQIRLARPLILLLSGLGVFWVATSVVTAIAAVVRLLRGGDITAAEAALVLLAVALALTTPVILAARHVAATIWDNSVRTVDLAERLRVPVLVGLCAYGFASLLVRAVEAVLLQRGAGIAWPVWDLLLPLFGAAGAFGAAWVVKQEARG